MGFKNVVLLLSVQQLFFNDLTEENVSASKNDFFNLLSDVYIPLFESFRRLERQKIPYKISLVIPPVMCFLLENVKCRDDYIKWLDSKVSLGEKELLRAEKIFQPIIFEILAKYKKTKELFLGYSCDLLKIFREYQNRGNVEIIATSSTEVFFPHYFDLKKVLEAQTKLGLNLYKKFFSKEIEGFYLPDMGYCDEVAAVLEKNSVNYTFLDSRSILLSENFVENGIFSPIRFANSLVAFAASDIFHDEIFGNKGFCQNHVYLDKNSDIGFELERNELEPFLQPDTARYELGYKYWNKSFPRQPYDKAAAKAQCKKDAYSFLASKIAKLNECEKFLESQNKLPESISLVIHLDVNKFLDRFLEGVDFIEELFISSSKFSDFSFECPKNLIKKRWKLQKIHPVNAAATGFGYGENLISTQNNWMRPLIRKASERMIDIAGRFVQESGFKVRLLDVAAKELLLAQSSLLQKMIYEGNSPDFAAQYFVECIDNFTRAYDALGSNQVDTLWLANLESALEAFSGLDFRLFL